MTMNIHIELTRDDFWCLSDKVPPDSPLRRAFEPKINDDGVGYVEFTNQGVQPLGGDFQMWCSKEGVEQLLGIAKQHCANAVYPISRALAGRP
jgi:hypothetical protein